MMRKKKWLSLCLCLFCGVLFAVPALADIIWEPPETSQPIPGPVSTGGGSGGGSGLLLTLAVSIICVALGVMIALIVRQRKGRK